MTKRERTNKKILECAREAFIDKGFHGADIGYIASLVGIDKRTIYRYYESKESLAFAVWIELIDTLMGVGEGAEGDTGYEKLEYTLHKYIKAVFQNREIVRFLGEFDHVFSGEYPKIKEAQEFVEHIRTNTSWIEQYIRIGYDDKSIRQDIDCQLTANTIASMLLALSERVIIRGNHLKEEQGNSDEMLDEAVSLILRSIKS